MTLMVKLYLWPGPFVVQPYSDLNTLAPGEIHVICQQVRHSSKASHHQFLSKHLQSCRAESNAVFNVPCGA